MSMEEDIIELQTKVSELETAISALETADHVLSYSAEQIDAFFALLDERVFASGRKTVEITNNTTVYGTAFLTAEELGVTNITDDIRVIFTVRRSSSVSANPYYDRYGTSVFKDTLTGKLCLKFAETGYNLALGEQCRLERGTYCLDWLRIG